MALSDLQIAVLVERYVRERDRFDKLATTVSRHLSARLRDAAVPHVPTFRSKEPKSLRGKLDRDRANLDFGTFERDFAPAILDLAGVRILLYRPRDLDQTCATIEDQFQVPAEARFRRDYARAEGYQARHRVLSLRDEQIDADPALSNLRGVPCEVQVVALGDHIWNELEHDIKYKTPHGRPTEVQDAWLKTLRAQLNSVRDTVNHLMDATDRQRAEALVLIETPEDLHHALKVRCERTLVGDFERVLMLLSAVLREVTPAALHRLPLAPTDLDRAQTLLEAAGRAANREDLSLIVAALWQDYGKDFVDVAKSWPGKPGPVARLVRALDKASTDGRI